MLINEVESIVGISKKSIRYYEEQGLLNPKRNQENDYRVYDEKDIKQLKLIKFLRELNVPIHDIKKLKLNELSIQECMKDRISKIEESQKNYQKIKNMCIEIKESESSYNDIDITNYSVQMNILNKEGFTMRDVKKNNRKKISGAFFSSLFFCLLFLFLIGIITYFQLNETDKMPWILYGFFMFILCIPIIGITMNLILRIKEIKGGEEDEASKY